MKQQEASVLVESEQIITVLETAYTRAQHHYRTTGNQKFDAGRVDGL
jgi:hypothetical protein